MQPVSIVVKRIMRAKGFTQSQVSKALRISQMSISYYVNDRWQPKRINREKIERYCRKHGIKF